MYLLRRRHQTTALVLVLAAMLVALALAVVLPGRAEAGHVQKTTNQSVSVSASGEVGGTFLSVNTFFFVNDFGEGGQASVFWNDGVTGVCQGSAPIDSTDLVTNFDTAVDLDVTLTLKGIEGEVDCALLGTEVTLNLDWDSTAVTSTTRSNTRGPTFHCRSTGTTHDARLSGTTDEIGIAGSALDFAFMSFNTSVCQNQLHGEGRP